MADLREPFELCKVLQNGPLVGISRLTGSENVLLTFNDRRVLVYNLEHQKLINSWSVEQQDEVTSAAVYNPVDKTFLMALNKTEIFMWKETDSDFSSCQRIQSEKNVCCLHVWNYLEVDTLVMFEDGSSMFLAYLLHNSEERKAKRRKASKCTNDLLWTCVFHHQEQLSSVSLRKDEKNEYILNVTNHTIPAHLNPKNETMEFKVAPPEKDAEPLCWCLYEGGYHLVSYWSTGALCLTELETVLEQKQGDEMLTLSCKTIQRLQPLHSESNKKCVAMSAIDLDRVCLCGSSMIDGKLKDVVMIWNIKYGTLQSWQTLDKIVEKQSSLLSYSRSRGACSVCCIPGFICIGFHHLVAVCQVSIEASSLASALGQLDSTAKFLRTDKVKPELLVTPKLARPGEALKHWQETIARDDEVEKEALQNLTDPSKTPTLEAFSTELRKYMELKLSGKDEEPENSNQSLDSSKAVPVFGGKFGKRTEVLSQHFISSVLSRCAEEKSFWARDSISELLKTKCVPSSCIKDLVNAILEKNDLELLEESFENISGISEDTVVLCARHILRLDHGKLDKTSQENLTEESEGEVVDRMPLDKTQAKYLDQYLLSMITKKFAHMVLDWAGLLLNAHYTQMVLMPEAQEVLVSCHQLVAQQVRTYDKLRTVECFLDHFRKRRKALPKAEKVTPYSIETLEL
ncbi:Nucleolar protein 11 [Stylophora pistillata]|uniref:Nucleolar protein 11 n=1 Tax=Stylophora pistillata TaxID=50429 RepID=A0A2B4S292_STYPI|nr:Nucleolar protein 11 [Stylophora pistillata]